MFVLCVCVCVVLCRYKSEISRSLVKGYQMTSTNKIKDLSKPEGLWLHWPVHRISKHREESPVIVGLLIYTK
jgi:hypothetical protein